MFEQFEQFLKKSLPAITGEELALIRRFSIMKKLARKEHLWHEGQMARYKIFVLKGLMRSYGISADGNEHVMKFTPEEHWTTDPDSYVNQVPSRFNMEAIEPSVLILWTREDFERLRSASASLNELAEQIVRQTISETQRRIQMNISSTAEEKYLYFLNEFPDISTRVPLHMIASYLGISRETLTRIRQGLAVASR